MGGLQSNWPAETSFFLLKECFLTSRRSRMRLNRRETVMNLAIPSELQEFVDREFATGRYESKDEVVVEALRLLKDERDDAAAGIKAGLADVEAGRTQPLSEAFSDIRKEFGISGS
jgi:putative addiction module CopG family antidote